MKYFIDSILFSYAQIVFSNRRYVGGAVLTASLFHTQVGLMGLFGVIFANWLAHLLRFDSEKIRTGFYGFNGILFASAALFYFKLNFYFLAVIPLFLVIVFFISSAIEHYFATHLNLPGLSLPFVISVYLLMAFVKGFEGIENAGVYLSNENLISVKGFFTTYFEAIGLIIFQPTLIAGVIILTGMFLFSRLMVIVSLISYAVCFATVVTFHDQVTREVLLTCGFNSILTSVALGGVFIIASSKIIPLSILSSVFSVIFTLSFYNLFESRHIPVLVLPFNIIAMGTLYSFRFRQEISDLVLLYFNPGSPEENYYYHENRKNRFQKFKYFFPELPFFGEWTVSQAFNGEFTHKDKWKYAWDFVVTDEEGKQYAREGLELADYYCFKLPVISVLDGTVVRVIDGIPNNSIGNVNLERNWGNTVIIDHYQGLFSAMSHLESGTIKVKVGDFVQKGSIIGLCGNSGRSPYPHLHFQFQASDILGAATIQYPFSHYLRTAEDGRLIHESFAYPVKDMKLRDPEPHSILTKAFTFSFGEKLHWEFGEGKKKTKEVWEVKVNIQNVLYLESSTGDTAVIYKTGRAIYLTDYYGKRNSALFYFYMCAQNVLLSYHEKLSWTDFYAMSLFDKTPLNYIQELNLLFGKGLSAQGNFMFSPRIDSKDFVISGQIEIAGKGFLGSIKRTAETTVTISEDSLIQQFNFTGFGKNFTANRIEEK